MKRLFSLFLSVVFILQLSAVVPLFAAEEFVISASNETIIQGETSVDVILSAANNPGVAGAIVSVGYPEQFNITKVEYIAEGFASLDTTAIKNNFQNPQKLSWDGLDADNNSGKIAKVTFSVPADITAGKYDITVSYKVGEVYDDNLDDVYLTTTNGSVTVTEKPKENLPDNMSLTTDKANYTYGDTVNVSVANLAEGATVKYVVNDGTPAASVSIKDAGIYTISAVVSKDGYNDKTLDAITVTIGKKDVTISGLTAEDKTYDGTDSVTVNKSSVVIDGKVEGDDLSATFPELFKLDSANAGNRTVVLTGTALAGADAANYNLTKVEEVKVNVAARPITVTAANTTKTINTADPTFSASVTAGTLADGQTIEYTVTREAGEEVGKYAIIPAAVIKSGETNVTANYAITYVNGELEIIDAVLEDIKIDTLASDLSYIEDQTLDLTGLVVKAKYDNSDEWVVINPTVTPAAGYKFTADDAAAVTKTVEVTFGDKKVTFDVTVAAKVLNSLKVVANKTEYIEDEDFAADITVYPVYNNDVAPESYDDITGYTVSTPNMKQIGEQTLTVGYNGVEGKYQINVAKMQLQRLEVVGKLTKSEYVEGHTFDPAGVSFKAHYDNGKSYNVALDDSGITYNKTTLVPTDTEVTFTYQDKNGNTASVGVTIKVEKRAVKTVTITNISGDYIEGQTINPTDIAFEVVYNDSDEPVPMNGTNDLIVNAADPLTAGTVSVTITYGGVPSAAYNLDVAEKQISKIRVDAQDKLTKTTYVDGNAFEKDAVVVYVTYDNFPAKEYKLTPDAFDVNVEKFELNNSENEEVVITITVTDKDGDKFSDTFTVTVEPAAVTVNGVNYSDIDTALSAVVEILANEEEEISEPIEVKIFRSVTIKTPVNFANKTGSTSAGVKLVVEPLPGAPEDADPVVLTQDAPITSEGTDMEFVVGEGTEIKQNADIDSADSAVKVTVEEGASLTQNDANISSGEGQQAIVEVMGDAEIEVKVNGKEETVSKEAPVASKPIVAEVNGKGYETIDEALAAAIALMEDEENEDEIVVKVVKTCMITVPRNFSAPFTFKTEKDVKVTSTAPLTVDEDVKITYDIQGESIDITINDEKVTLEGDGSYIDESETKEDEAYKIFEYQMMQWRNLKFYVFYKQTTGGTVEGLANARIGQTVEITITPDEGYEGVDVLVNGKSVGAVESYKIRNVKANTTVSAVFEKIAPVSPFVDVDVNAPYYDAVVYVYENGIINGVSETEMVFAPNTTMTRAMFVTVLGRMAGVDMADFADVTFADCEAGSWYAPFVEWAAQAGIVNGYSAESFGPMDEITVEQAAVILYRFAEYMGYSTAADADLANYADGAQVSEWAAEQMKWALANNIYTADTTLDPQTSAIRSLVAEMLYNLSVWMG